jgi:hypothetical protein
VKRNAPSSASLSGRYSGWRPAFNGAAGEDGEATRSRAGDDFSDEARLAQTRLAAEEHHRATSSVLGGFQGAEQMCQFGVAADQLGAQQLRHKAVVWHNALSTT